MGSETWPAPTSVKPSPPPFGSMTDIAERRQNPLSRPEMLRTAPSRQSIWNEIGNPTSKSASVMLVLEMAAEAGDEQDFVEAAASLEWEQFAAVDIAYAVRLALKAGAHVCARNLALRGARLFPEDGELRRMACVLAPPRVTRRGSAPNETLKQNREWLEQHRAEYPSRWVAVRRGQFLAAASSLGELNAFLERVGLISSPDVLIAQVS